MAGAAAGAAMPQGASQPQAGFATASWLAAAQPQAGASHPQAGSQQRRRHIRCRIRCRSSCFSCSPGCRTACRKTSCASCHKGRSSCRKQELRNRKLVRTKCCTSASRCFATASWLAAAIAQPLSQHRCQQRRSPCCNRRASTASRRSNSPSSHGSQHCHKQVLRSHKLGLRSRKLVARRSTQQELRNRKLVRNRRCASQQAGASHPQAGSAQHIRKQVLRIHKLVRNTKVHHTPVSQQLLALPQPLHPSIRSKRSNPKLWLQMLQPRTRAIVIIVRFIGATSPLSQFRGSIFVMSGSHESPSVTRLFGRGAFGGRSRRRAHLQIPQTNTNGSGADTRPADFVQLVDLATS